MPDVISNRGTLTKKLFNNRAIKSSGSTFKFIGITTENGTNLLEATWVQVEKEEKEAANRVSTVKMKGDLINQGAISSYNKFLQSGRRLDKYEHPDIDRQDFTVIIKFLLPIVAPNKDIYLSYSYKLKAKQLLERLKKEEGIFWEEMIQQAIRKEGVHM